MAEVNAPAEDIKYVYDFKEKVYKYLHYKIDIEPLMKVWLSRPKYSSKIGIVKYYLEIQNVPHNTRTVQHLRRKLTVIAARRRRLLGNPRPLDVSPSTSSKGNSSNKGEYQPPSPPPPNNGIEAAEQMQKSSQSHLIVLEPGEHQKTA